MSYTLTISFEEFVQYLVDKDNHQINPHFQLMIDICWPCEIKYNFYTNFKLFSQDAGYIVHKIHAQPEYYWDVSLHTNAAHRPRIS